MKKVMRSLLSYVLVVVLMVSTSTSVFAQETSNSFSSGGFSEKIEKRVNKDGSIEVTNLITNKKTGEVTKVVINDNDYSRNVKVYIDNELDKQVSLDKSKSQLEVKDASSGKVELNKIIPTSGESSTIAQSMVSKSSPSYPYLQSLYNSSLKQWGYLYGGNTVSYGPKRVIKISEGTAWGTAVGIVAGIVLPGCPVLSVLAALGCSAFGVTIDTLLTGNIYARTTRWDYEVFSQGKLGLRVYQNDVDEKIIDTQSGKVKYVDAYEDGYEGDREDMLYAGIYYVYIHS